MRNTIITLVLAALAALGIAIYKDIITEISHKYVQTNVVPQIKAAISQREILVIVDYENKNPFEGAYDVEYSVYGSQQGTEYNGKFIRRIDGKDKTDEQSNFKGLKRDSQALISYSSAVAGNTGSGSFNGKLIPGTSIYVGELRGYAHDERGSDRKVETFWAVLGSEKDYSKFSQYGKNYASNNTKQHHGDTAKNTEPCKPQN